jgi:hypothetical protein
VCGRLFLCLSLGPPDSRRATCKLQHTGSANEHGHAVELYKRSWLLATPLHPSSTFSSSRTRQVRLGLSPTQQTTPPSPPKLDIMTIPTHALLLASLFGPALATFLATAPGPGDVFAAGSMCSIQWKPDTDGVWTNMTIGTSFICPMHINELISNQISCLDPMVDTAFSPLLVQG